MNLDISWICLQLKKWMILILIITTFSSASMVFDFSTGNDLVLISHNSQFYPICSSNWNTSWNAFVCQQYQFGYAVSYQSIDPSVTTFSSNGYFLPQNGTPVTTLEDVLSSNPTSNCSSGKIVAVKCSYDECGMSIKKLASRKKIIGGINALPGAWPWQVAIHLNYEPSSKIYCGGVLINKEWVVTAAHCVKKNSNNTQDYLLVFGDTSLPNTSSDFSRQERVGRQIFCHEGIIMDGVKNDIALIRLDTPVTFTFYVHPVCLPVNGYKFPSTSICYAAGWGYTAHSQYVSSNLPDNLKEVPLDIISDDMCVAFLPDSVPFESDQMVCAGQEIGQTAICKGDSGGALACIDATTNAWYLAGISSWIVSTDTYKCASHSVFADVPNYITWIEQTIASNLTYPYGRCNHSNKISIHLEFLFCSILVNFVISITKG